MWSFTAYSVLNTAEQWIKGYRIEHLQLGLQQGIAQAVALLPVLVQQLFTAVDRGGSSLFIAVTVAVVLEPSTGDAFRKLLLRVAAAGVSGGIGILFLFFAVGSNSYTYSHYQHEVAAWVVPCVAVFSFVFATNQQRYWHQREFWTVALLTLPIVVVPAVRAAPGTFYTGACYRMLDVVIGVGLAAAISYFVFPVRARTLLEKRMASTLIRVGDLAVWLVGQACVPPAPGGGAMAGRSGTDSQCLYSDDGLRAKMAPLMRTTNQLADDISAMWPLLEAANAELSLFPPRRFPTAKYRNLLHSCHISMGIFYTLINAMQSGDVTLEVCQRYVGDISEAGVRLSAGFTALGSLIRPPTVKRPKRRRRRRRGRPAEQPQQQQQQQGQTGEPAQGTQRAGGLPPPDLETAEEAEEEAEAEAAAGSVDDPFEGMEDEHSEAGQPPAPVVGLSDSQLLSAQQMARHLSRVMTQASEGATKAPAAAKLAPVMEGSGSQPAPLGGGGRAALAAGGEKPSMGTGSMLAGSSSGAQRRDWVLQKLQALVDSVQDLEAATVHERTTNFGSAGISSFLLLSHALINLTRQCGACFTALDPDRGAALHLYYQQGRQGARLL